MIKIIKIRIYFCIPEICSSAVNSQRLMCSQKAGVKCSYVLKFSGIQIELSPKVSTYYIGMNIFYEC